MSLLSPLVPVFPNTLVNGTPADASQVMADFNTLRNAINNSLNATGATGGDQYVGLTTDARFNGTSVHDALTQLVDRQSLYTDTGTTNALVITPTPAMTALTAGQVFWFKPANTTTTGAATIAIGANGAVGIANWDGTLLLAGMLIAGSYYLGVTAGPGNPIRVLNPSRLTGSVTLTIATGLTTTPTFTLSYAVGSDGFGVDAWTGGGTTGTSNAIGMTWTGVPAIIQAVTKKDAACSGLVDNGAGTMGGIEMTASSGTWTIEHVGNANGWTNTGTKGIATAGFYAHFSKD